MTLFKDKYRSETTRLQEWSYSLPGYYYVTICVKDRKPSLGEIVDGRMVLSKAGVVVSEEWRKINKTAGNVKLDEWIVMPNHLHGIVVIEDYDGASDVETIHELSLRDPLSPPPERRLYRRRMLLSKIIGKFKMQSAKRVNLLRGTSGEPFWQPRFYDHVLRDNLSLDKIRDYIRSNPLNLDSDRNNLEDLIAR